MFLKKPLFSLLVFAAMSVGVQAIAAENSPWYVGGAVGASHADPNFDARSGGSFNKNDTGYQVYLGYAFNPTWAAEVQYVDMGKFTYTQPGGTSYGKSDGIGISVLGFVPLSSSVKLFGKLAVQDQKFKFNVSTPTASANASTTKAVPVFGVGLEYGLNQQWALRAEYDYFNVPKLFDSGGDFKPDMSLLSVGLRYQF